MKKKPISKNQKGFTLIEVITVLLILGIMAAVAIPKYFGLVGDAKLRALDGALAESVARVNQHFAAELLKGIDPLNVHYDENTLGTDLGDFTLTVKTEGVTVTLEEPVDPKPIVQGIELTVEGKADTVCAGISKIKTIPKPGNLPV